MDKNRLEAFSDGVLAITIMVLEIKVPYGANWQTFQTLQTLVPVFLSDVLSFIYIGIYWNNSHHLFRVAKVVGKCFKGAISVVVYAIAVPLAFMNVWLAEIGYIAVALLRLIPDQCIEKTLSEHSQ